jgi:hypothetical protein
VAGTVHGWIEEVAGPVRIPTPRPAPKRNEGYKDRSLERRATNPLLGKAVRGHTCIRYFPPQWSKGLLDLRRSLTSVGAERHVAGQLTTRQSDDGREMPGLRHIPHYVEVSILLHAVAWVCGKRQSDVGILALDRDRGEPRKQAGQFARDR